MNLFRKGKCEEERQPDDIRPVQGDRRGPPNILLLDGGIVTKFDRLYLLRENASPCSSTHRYVHRMRNPGAAHGNVGREVYGYQRCSDGERGTMAMGTSTGHGEGGREPLINRQEWQRRRDDRERRVVELIKPFEPILARRGKIVLSLDEELAGKLVSCGVCDDPMEREVFAPVLALKGEPVCEKCPRAQPRLVGDLLAGSPKPRHSRPHASRQGRPSRDDGLGSPRRFIGAPD